MKFSIAVITRNRGDKIRAVLRSIKEIEYSPENYELVVVDNGSTDNTATTVKQELEGALFNWSIQEEKIKGICRARNKGAFTSEGDWVIYVDDDAIVPANWLCAYEKAIELFQTAIVFGGPADLDSILIRPWWWCKKFDWTMSCQDYGNEMRPYPEGGHPYGLNMMINRDALLKAGGFNPRLDDEISSFADETELFIRLMKRGNQLIYVPEAKVIHCVEQNRLAWKAYMARRELVGRSHAYLDYHHGTEFKHPFLKHLRIAIEDFFMYLTPAVFVQELYEWKGYRKYISEVSDAMT